MTAAEAVWLIRDRDTAAHKPGSLSRVGLRTFVDPRWRQDQCTTTDDLIELPALDGEEFLFYRSFRLDVAMVRGTTADPNGNVTMEREALMAMGAQSTPGYSGELRVSRLGPRLTSYRGRVWCQSLAGIWTPDLGGASSTEMVTDALRDRIAAE